VAARDQGDQRKLDDLSLAFERAFYGAAQFE
jgi:hypothetical protein